MKSLSLIFAFLCSAILLCAQDADMFLKAFPVDDGKVSYQGVVNVEEISAEDLYLQARKWVATHYVGFGEIRVASKEEGLIIAKSVFSKDLNLFHQMDIWYSLTLEFKDGRFRYTLSDVLCEYQSVMEYAIEPIEKWLYPTKAKVNNESVYIKYTNRLNKDFEYIIEDMISEMTELSGQDTW